MAKRMILGLGRLIGTYDSSRWIEVVPDPVSLDEAQKALVAPTARQARMPVSQPIRAQVLRGADLLEGKVEITFYIRLAWEEDRGSRGGPARDSEGSWNYGRFRYEPEVVMELVLFDACDGRLAWDVLQADGGMRNAVEYEAIDSDRDIPNHQRGHILEEIRNCGSFRKWHP